MKKNNSSSARASQKKSPATSQKPTAYYHQKIEKKWQKMWDEQQLYKTLSAREARKKKMKPYYVLDMFPYPSGAGLHVGHPRGYIASDIFARMKRMQGYNVLHPMGFDSFGLPAEQYAIQTGKNPATFTQQLVKRYREQLSQLGFSYDWDRQVATHDPEYYQWTQWIFLQIYNSWYDRSKQKARPIADLEKEFARKGNSNINAVCDENTPSFSKTDWKQFSDLEKQNILMKYRLAYEGYAEVNWCAELGTVLANDEVIEVGGKMVSERGEFPVVKKPMRQWFMRITAYADRLIEGLDTVDWSHSIKEIQRNWIGKSEGSEIEFKISTDSSPTLPQEMGCKVFTTRADTLFGVTYVVLAPEHPLVAELKSQITNWNKVEKYITSVKSKSDEDRVAAKEKTGICLEGIYAINPANEEQVPVWIADYVLAGYGTGAVMAVPAHDERDFEFAQKYDLSIKRVVTDNLDINYTEEESLFCNLKEGRLISSGKFNGLTSEEARKAITEFVGGKLVTKYKMRDAIFARQRYWGEPIPLVHTQEGIIKTVSEKQLPLKLPPVKSYAPSGNGEGPLGTVKSWVTAGYETNTMPGWAGSSWYFLRYIDPKNKKSFASQDELDYWFSSQKKTKGASSQGAVNMYVGGSEHATGHLLYSRLWHKILKDLGYFKAEEPFQTLRNQGLIMGPDGRKMSKRWGNVINPDDVVRDMGADTLRVYEAFMGPFESSQPWSTDGIVGARRFIERVWNVSSRVSQLPTDPELEKVIHKTIKKVTEDIINFSFNTAVSSMMIAMNEIDKKGAIHEDDFKKFLQLLAPFAPHMTEELWARLTSVSKKKTSSIHTSPWPLYNPKKVIDNTITLGVQVNGKVRAEITLALDAKEHEVRDRVVSIPEVMKWIDGKEIKKFIYIPGKIISIVI